MNPDRSWKGQLQRHRARLYLLGHGLIVLAVIWLFHEIAEKRIAALIAGSLFILGPSVVILSEIKYQGYARRYSFWGALLFLLISALPIFLLRILNWNEAFENLQMLGLPAPLWHKLANKAFLGMLVTYLLDSIFQKAPEK